MIAIVVYITIRFRLDILWVTSFVLVWNEFYHSIPWLLVTFYHCDISIYGVMSIVSSYLSFRRYICSPFKWQQQQQQKRGKGTRPQLSTHQHRLCVCVCVGEWRTRR